ncbi:hypothetical protein [Thermoplasma volcanium GSS1]|uniref:Metallo-beta-lactamase domain-containing protein n=1 Tax=Thermoplasma volcanium (strain ATCC 51530 / DSM 4299 / JCM 9571 / NBRC 15438 / GSS1) TaxID=273116 RepID=Q97A52_THEVO|nr:MBL fold metallo-hydrolase [Thermoplasma volcanium]BAB60100.1 hypothetical protein [Thermoplasma volcanium GSS1]
MQTHVETFTVPIAIRALKTANIYRVPSDKGYILIDTGMSGDSVDQIVKESNDIQAVFLTHLHIDHVGGALRIHEELGVPVYMNSKDINLIRQVANDKEAYIKKYVDIFRGNGVPLSMQEDLIHMHPVINFYEYYSKLGFLQDISNLKLKELKFVPVPGHSPGSTAVITEDGYMMFSGDHILERITPNISVYGEEDDLGNYLKSLELVKKLSPKIIFPGHGSRIDDPLKRISEIEEHHAERIRAIAQALNESKTAFEIAESIPWSKGRKMDTMNFMEKNFAILETISHLRHMEAIGMVDSKDENGIIKYRIIK